MNARIGYVLAHELAHVTLASKWNMTVLEKLLYGYERSTLSEALADVLAVRALLRAGLLRAEELCMHVSQIWCARTAELTDDTPSGVGSSRTHPRENFRGDMICAQCSSRDTR